MSKKFIHSLFKKKKHRYLAVLGVYWLIFLLSIPFLLLDGGDPDSVVRTANQSRHRQRSKRKVSSYYNKQFNETKKVFLSKIRDTHKKEQLAELLVSHEEYLKAEMAKNGSDRLITDNALGALDLVGTTYQNRSAEDLLVCFHGIIGSSKAQTMKNYERLKTFHNNRELLGNITAKGSIKEKIASIMELEQHAEAYKSPLQERRKRSIFYNSPLYDVLKHLGIPEAELLTEKFFGLFRNEKTNLLSRKFERIIYAKPLLLVLNVGTSLIYILAAFEFITQVGNFLGFLGSYLTGNGRFSQYARVVFSSMFGEAFEHSSYGQFNIPILMFMNGSLLLLGSLLAQKIGFSKKLKNMGFSLLGVVNAMWFVYSWFRGSIYLNTNAGNSFRKLKEICFITILGGPYGLMNLYGQAIGIMNLYWNRKPILMLYIKYLDKLSDTYDYMHCIKAVLDREENEELRAVLAEEYNLIKGFLYRRNTKGVRIILSKIRWYMKNEIRDVDALKDDVWGYINPLDTKKTNAIWLLNEWQSLINRRSPGYLEYKKVMLTLYKLDNAIKTAKKIPLKKKKASSGFVFPEHKEGKRPSLKILSALPFATHTHAQPNRIALGESAKPIVVAGPSGGGADMHVEMAGRQMCSMVLDNLVKSNSHAASFNMPDKIAFIPSGKLKEDMANFKNINDYIKANPDKKVVVFAIDPFSKISDPKIRANVILHYFGEWKNHSNVSCMFSINSSKVLEKQDHYNVLSYYHTGWDIKDGKPAYNYRIQKGSSRFDSDVVAIEEGDLALAKSILVANNVSSYSISTLFTIFSTIALMAMLLALLGMGVWFSRRRK